MTDEERRNFSKGKNLCQVVFSTQGFLISKPLVVTGVKSPKKLDTGIKNKITKNFCLSF